MWIEMNNLNLELYSRSTDKKSAVDPKPAEVIPELPTSAQTQSPSAEISLQLKKFQQKIHEAPIVNEHKVNALKQQISDRTYGVLNPNIDIVKESALRMADKMLHMENDLFGKKS
jgi:anti-sigma28 factor (negative regulator of flagellin synthesis)